MEWVVGTLLPHEVRRLSRQLSNQQKGIEEKDAALTLLTDDLQDRNNQIQAIQYKNVALQAQRDIIIHLRTRCVDHARDPGKDNIIIIVWKHTTSANDKCHDLPYYVARIQRQKKVC